MRRAARRAARLGYAAGSTSTEEPYAATRGHCRGLHQRQADFLPGRFGLVVTRIAEGALDAEVALQPWMLAPNGFLHAASVLLLADTTAGYASIAHLPDRAKNFTTIELKSNFLGTVREGTIRDRVPCRAPWPHDPRLVVRRLRRRGPAHRALSLHPADLVVTAADAVVTKPRPVRAGRRRAGAAAARRRRSATPRSTSCRQLLDAVPAPLEPLDVGVARRLPLRRRCVQPTRRSRRRAGCRSSPMSTAGRCRRGFDARRLHALVRPPPRRARRARSRSATGSTRGCSSCDDGDGRRRPATSPTPAVACGLPWVAGFAAALETFPGAARRSRRRRADRAAGAALPPPRRRRPRRRRRAARGDRRARAAGRPRPRRSRSWCGRRCCSPTSRGVAALPR